jgi:hypothetical protein
LNDLLTQTEAMLRGRLDLRGDLWPAIEDEDEENTMSQSERDRTFLCMQAITNAGIPLNAQQDALRRLETHFDGRDIDAIDAHSFVQELRTSARHLFSPVQAQHSSPAGTPRPGPVSNVPVSGVDKPRRPQPLQLTPAQQDPSLRMIDTRSWR